MPLRLNDSCALLFSHTKTKSGGSRCGGGGDGPQSHKHNGAMNTQQILSNRRRCRKRIYYPIDSAPIRWRNGGIYIYIQDWFRRCTWMLSMEIGEMHACVCVCARRDKLCIPIRLITLNPNSLRYFRRFSTIHSLTRVTDVSRYIYLGTCYICVHHSKSPMSVTCSLASLAAFYSIPFFLRSFCLFLLLFSVFSITFAVNISSFTATKKECFPLSAHNTPPPSRRRCILFLFSYFEGHTRGADGAPIGMRRENDRAEKDFLILIVLHCLFLLFVSLLLACTRIHSFILFAREVDSRSLFVDLMERFICFEQRENKVSMCSKQE